MEPQDNDVSVPSIKPSWPLLAIGVVAGVVPFVIHVSSSSTSFVNGELAASTYRDWVAVIGGGVAVVCGIGHAIMSARSELGRGKNVALAVLVIALGGYQLASGFGVFQPSPTASPSPVADREPVDEHAPPVLDAAPKPPGPPPPVCADAETCNKLGSKLDDAGDTKGAYAAYLAGCGADARGNCYMASSELRELEPGDPPKVRALLGQACDLEMWKACGVLGVDQFTGFGGTKDAAKALALLTKGCDGRDGQSCYNLGVFYRDGTEVAANDAKAYELFTLGCDLEDAKGCNEQGIWLFDGRLHRKDPKAAVARFTKACDLDDKFCFSLGVATEHGDGGVHKDAVKARALYSRACKADSNAACNNLGDLMNRGLGGPKDLEQAKTLFQRACDGGFDLACTNAKGMK